jgi:hypothetical protein
MSWKEFSGRGINESEVIKASLLDNDSVIAVTEQGIYKSGLQADFTLSLQFPPGEHHVYSIYHQSDASWIAVVLRDEVWASDDEGVQWSKIFHLTDSAASCYSVFRDGQNVFIGTSQGIYKKHDSEETWHRDIGELNARPIFEISGDDQYMFFAVDHGVYRINVSQTDDQAQKVFSTISFNHDEEDFYFDDDSSGTDPRESRAIRDICYRDGFLAVVTKSGIWLSVIRGFSGKGFRRTVFR